MSSASTTTYAVGMLAVLGFLCAPALLTAASLININTASQAELETLSGIGPAKAQAVIDYRTQHGDFADIADITDVSGIGPATYDGIKDFITVGDTTEDTTDDTDDTDDTSDDTDNTTDDTTDETSSSGGGSGGGGKREVSFATEGDLGVSLKVPERGYVHHPVSFSAIPEGLSASELMTMRYFWNFGDGVALEDKRTPRHTYTEPGTYRVVVRVWRGDREVVARERITILPVSVSLSYTSEGAVVIRNESAHEVDLSKAQLTNGVDTYILPAYTYLLAGESLMLHSDTTRFASVLRAYAAIRDPRGALLAEYSAHIKSAPPKAARNTSSHTSVSSAPEELAKEESAGAEKNTTEQRSTSTQAASIIQADDERGLIKNNPATYAFIGVLLLGVFTLYVHRFV